MPKRKTDAELDRMYHGITTIPYISSSQATIDGARVDRLRTMAKGLLMQMKTNPFRSNEEANQYWQYGYVKG